MGTTKDRRQGFAYTEEEEPGGEILLIDKDCVSLVAYAAGYTRIACSIQEEGKIRFPQNSVTIK